MCLLSDRQELEPANTSCPLCTFLTCGQEVGQGWGCDSEATAFFNDGWTSCMQWACVHAGWQGSETVIVEVPTLREEEWSFVRWGRGQV